MKKILLAFLSFIFFLSVDGQKRINLYTSAAPGSETWNWDEVYLEKSDWNTPMVYNVSKPSLEVYEPEIAKKNGTAVIIAPGGAFMGLSIKNEGTDVAKYLTDKGITAFVLRYRLMHALTDNPVQELNKMWGTKEFNDKASATIPLSIADGKAAIAYVRSHAGELGIAPNRIGIMGFSAGGTVTASAAFNYTPENKPDFVAPIYAFMPEMLMGKTDSTAPPMFLAVANDDGLQLASHSLDLYSRWTKAKAPVELHVYEKGDHGFGMRKQMLPSDGWIERFSEWLDNKGFYKPYDFSLELYERKQFDAGNGNSLPYRVLYPENYDANKKYPLVVLLHGSGERGSDNEAQLTHGGKLFINEQNRKDFPAIVIFPQCPKNSSWNTATTDRTKTPPEREFNYSSTQPNWPLKAVTDLVNSLIEEDLVDKKRVYLTGLSMGGFGTFEAVGRNPKMFAAAMPICGGGDVNAFDKKFKNYPFWVFHGDDDKAVDVKYSRQMVNKLKQVGARVKYSEYAGVGHNSWDNAFAEPQFLKWMFDQKQ